VTDDNGNHNAAIVRDMGNGEYKWCLLFPPGGECGVSIDGNRSDRGNVFVKTGILYGTSIPIKS